MAKAENQKKKMLYIRDYFLCETDEEHGITVKQIIAYLKSECIDAERKSIYDDIRCLQDYGMDIISEKVGRETYYKLASREFELPELKLLVDSVQSSNFISRKKTDELIQKLDNLTSKHQAKDLRRHVFSIDRVKSPNNRVLNIVDVLHEAINKKKRIRFQYGTWNVKKELELRHDGKFYNVSPWELGWDRQNYYLIGFDHDAGKHKNFRVDRMSNATIVQDEGEYREGDKKILMTYYKKTFGMFGGDAARVKLKVSNSLVNPMLDQFGRDAMLIPSGEEGWFIINEDVVISQQFIGWLVGLGTGIEVLEPESLREELKRSLNDILKKY